jgi:hypothetical protein
MKPKTVINPAGKLKRKRAVADLLDAVEGIPRRQKAALMSRILKDVVAGNISAAEANEIAKAGKR